MPTKKPTAKKKTVKKSVKEKVTRYVRKITPVEVKDEITVTCEKDRGVFITYPDGRERKFLLVHKGHLVIIEEK